MSEFKIPNVSTLIGSNFKNFIKIVGEGNPDRKYWRKIFLTGLLVIISTPFHLWERIVFNRRVKQYKFKEPPVFILGHWRSGTTFLHNTLCTDEDAGFITTYQGLFPNNLASKLIFRTYMKAKMPDKRPADNMDLNINFPQEDEFGIGNLTHLSYYLFFYYPTLYRKYFKRAVQFEENEKDIDSWVKMYRKLITKAAINSKKDRIIVKNPVNTGRVKILLRAFPEAKFIYIYRNPVDVILSTRRFFYPLMPTLWLQEVDQKFIDNMIFEIYNEIMDMYESEKNLIPDNNLISIKYEEFIKSPLVYIEKIHRDLFKDEFEGKRSHYEKYLSRFKGRSGKKYDIKNDQKNEIESKVDKYLKLYQYKSPISS